MGNGPGPALWLLLVAPLAALLVNLFGGGSAPYSPPPVQPQISASTRELLSWVPTETPVLTPAPILTPAPTPDPVPEPPPAPPLPAPTALPAVPANDIERLVCSYSWPCGEALRIMWCESGGDPTTWVPWTATATPDDGVAGLFQIATHANGVRQWVGWDLFDPAQNVEAAYIMWSGNGGSWYPDWACRPW